LTVTYNDVLTTIKGCLADVNFLTDFKTVHFAPFVSVTKVMFQWIPNISYVKNWRLL